MESVVIAILALLEMHSAFVVHRDIRWSRKGTGNGEIDQEKESIV